MRKLISHPLLALRAFFATLALGRKRQEQPRRADGGDHFAQPQAARPALYPLLLAVYPVLALLANNIAQVRPAVTLRSLALSLLGGLILYLVVIALLKNRPRAAVVTALLLALFFTYGHVYQLVEGRLLLGLRVGRHALLAPIWLGLLALGLGWISRHPAALPGLNSILAPVSLMLVGLALAQVGWFYIKIWQYNRAVASTPSAAPAALSAAPANRPDVYYIILDGYTRSDVLAEKYGFDNSDFLRGLQELGFVIPDCAQSNYAYTVLSLSSTFNMNYIETFSSLIQQGDTDRDWVAYQEFIRDNAVRRNFASLGYKLVAFETGYWWGEVTDADYYIIANDNPLAKYESGFEINSFEVLFLRTTALRVLSEASTRLLATVGTDIRTPEQKHFDRVNFSLSELAEIPALPGSKFVFAHIIAPHPPFVFTETGEFRDLAWKSEGYAPEIAYLNTRVLEAVRQILEKSTTPPVIVIQGDHGWDAENRMKILNAYYLPGGGAEKVYPQITPVNTFRLIFDQYFGGQYNFIPDISRFSTEEAIYQFSIVPPTCVSTP